MARPKKRKAYKTKLILPKDELRYKCQAVYHVLMEMKRKMEGDITSVRWSDYYNCLTEYTELAEALKKKGYTDGKATSVKRMEQRRLEKSLAEQERQTGSGEDRSPSVGAGVPPFNPLT